MFSVSSKVDVIKKFFFTGEWIVEPVYLFISKNQLIECANLHQTSFLLATIKFIA